MFRTLFRWLLTLAAVGLLVWFFAPRIFDNAANSLISSVDSHVQGMAEFVPAGLNSLSTKQAELQVNLSGLQPGSSYQLELDQDSCGGTSTPLSTLKANNSGGIYTEIALNSLDFTKTWYLNILEQGRSVACGLLQTNKTADSQIISTSQNVSNVFGPQDTPTAAATPTPGTGTSKTITTGLPNTGADPGNNQQYANNHFPRKY